MKLLLADSSEMFGNALKTQLAHRYEVSVCCDGAETARKLLFDGPDFLLLDMGLPGLDGFTILQALRNSGRKIPVVALVKELTQFEYNWLISLGVDCILEKPCTICQTMVRICELLRYYTDSKTVGEDAEAERILLALGFRMNLAGYACICQAVRLLADNPDQTLTKEIYPAVAALCGGTPESVERSMRTAIRDAWNRRNESVWMLYFALGRDGTVPCPKNGSFLLRIAGCLTVGRRKIG